MGLYDGQAGSVFIRESKSVRNKHIAVIIAIDLIISVLYGIYFYILTIDYSFSEKIIGIAASLAIDIAAVFVMIYQEHKKFKKFEEAVLSGNKDIFRDMEKQFAGAEKMFGAIYMLEDYMYVCTQNLFIPYVDIKKVRAAFSSINFINVASYIHIYCFSGRVYSISLRSAGEYRRRQNEFEDRLERHRQRSFAKSNGQNMYYK